MAPGECERPPAHPYESKMGSRRRSTLVFQEKKIPAENRRLISDSVMFFGAHSLLFVSTQNKPPKKNEINPLSAIRQSRVPA